MTERAYTQSSLAVQSSLRLNLRVIQGNYKETNDADTLCSYPRAKGVKARECLEASNRYSKAVFAKKIVISIH